LRDVFLENSIKRFTFVSKSFTMTEKKLGLRSSDPVTDKKAVYMQYIIPRRRLFWSVSDAKLPQISEILLVETILNFGTAEDVRALFELLGLPQVATIFYQHTENQVRTNYFPPVRNYFTLYFNRHVRKHSFG
jgi:hypothetical protein